MLQMQSMVLLAKASQQAQIAIQRHWADWLHRLIR